MTKKSEGLKCDLRSNMPGASGKFNDKSATKMKIKSNLNTCTLITLGNLEIAILAIRWLLSLAIGICNYCNHCDVVVTWRRSLVQIRPGLPFDLFETVCQK